VFARVTTYQGPPDRLDEGIRIFREQVVPWLRDSTGFRGWVALVDRENGTGIGISFWSTREAMEDKDASGAVLRDELAASLGTTMKSTAHYEVSVAEALSLEDAR
jgi:hypothetical protein